ncbi:MAG: magnesium transporter CorA family protein [Chthoniobacterales bacterium]
MITFYSPGERGVDLPGPQQCAELTHKAVWIDLFAPTQEEETALESALKIDIPTREEMQAIELSNRLYKEKDVLFMTGTVLTRADSSNPESSAVTFILTPGRLITLRYVDPFPFKAFRTRRDAIPGEYRTADDVLVGLIDAIVERVADILESVGASLDRISLEIFDAQAGTDASSRTSRRRRKPERDFVDILRRIGCNSDLISRTRESLVSFGRVVAFFREMHKDNPQAQDALVHGKTVGGDLSSLSDHATFMSGKVSFLLDATLGMINNEQNVIIKILSVAAVVCGPPTLIAGVYGMNFAVFPELKWLYGYPFALALMLLSAVLPYTIFKRKGWL